MSRVDAPLRSYAPHRIRTYGFPASGGNKRAEKIEMVRQLDNIYRLDHAVTANQKVILKAFGMDANSIKYFASELSKELKKAE